MIKLCPGPCQGIQAWRGKKLTAIAPVIVRSRIIGHNQDNVESLLGKRSRNQGKRANKNEKKKTTHFLLG
jgi:hypothetical protein